MLEEKKTVLSILNNQGTTRVVKKNIILSDLSRESFELSKKIMHIFSDYETKILFYSKKDDNFLDGDTVVESIEETVTNASLVFNFVSIKRQKSRDISRYVEKMNISTIQNGLTTRMIFSAKNNIKKILEAHNLKTPVFEFVGRKTSEESFVRVIQPSRIFSASNHFFSGKLESSQDIQKVYDTIGENISDYFIEEFVEGKDIYSFVFFRDNQILAYNIEKVSGDFVMIEEVLNKEISDYVRKMFLDLGIGKFALVNLKKSESRGIFVLNIFVD